MPYTMEREVEVVGYLLIEKSWAGGGCRKRLNFGLFFSLWLRGYTR
jgi:hypothetical protein